MYRKADNYQVMGRAGNSEIVFDKKMSNYASKDGNRKGADKSKNDADYEHGIEEESDPSVDEDSKADEEGTADKNYHYTGGLSYMYGGDGTSEADEGAEDEQEQEDDQA